MLVGLDVVLVLVVAVLGFKDKIDKSEASAGDIKSFNEMTRDASFCVGRLVSQYPYQRGIVFPSKILESRTANCVGKTMLCYSLLQKLGVDLYAALEPSHILGVVSSANGTLYIIDTTSDDYIESREKGSYELDGDMEKDAGLGLNVRFTDADGVKTSLHLVRGSEAIIANNWRVNPSG